jgi:hypothetical protein
MAASLALRQAVDADGGIDVLQLERAEILAGDPGGRPALPG